MKYESFKKNGYIFPPRPGGMATVIGGFFYWMVMGIKRPG